MVRGLQRSVSATQQFVIYYPDRTTRAQLARKVEDIKSAWLAALQLTDSWKYPIVVQIVTMPRAGSSSPVPLAGSRSTSIPDASAPSGKATKPRGASAAIIS